MRIAYVIPVFPEIHNTFVLNQITGMIDRGHEVDLYPLALGDFERAPKDVVRYELRSRIRQITVPQQRTKRVSRAATLLSRPMSWRRAVFAALDPRFGRSTWSLVPLYAALSFAGRKRYDVVHVQFGYVAPLFERIRANGGIDAALVTSFRGADATSHLPRHEHAYRQLFRSGEMFLPVSEDLRERVVAAGAPEERTFVHHSGIDLRKFPFRVRRREVQEPIRLLFVGRLVEKKGVRLALEALGRLRAGSSALAAPTTEVAGRPCDTGAPAIRFDVIGNGPLREELEAVADRLGVRDAVRFLGDRSHEEVAAAMQQAHVLIAPSVTASSGDREGIPNVLKEAMASGLPVVSTRHGGIKELVEDGVTGYLVEENDVTALANRIRHLIDRPDEWARLGTAGRAKVASEFGIEDLNDRLVERYLQAAAAWSTRRS